MKQSFQQVKQKTGSIHIIDSTVISLCLTRYRWAEFRKTKSGVKMHLRLRLFKESALPDAVVVTAARKADRTQMDQLVLEEQDAFNVFDRAYVDYEKFDYYCDQKLRFASRLKGNALVETVEESPVDPNSVITKDCRVFLGKAGLKQMKHHLRMIETADSEGKTIIIVTNDFALSAQ